MYFAGVDVGSVAAKAVILSCDQNSRDMEIIAFATQPTGWSPRDAGRAVFAKALLKAGLRHHKIENGETCNGETGKGAVVNWEVGRGDITKGEVSKVVGTGYGRVSLDFIDQAVTEITCHALGANYYFPGNSLVIDIGGQDSKAIRVNNRGKVSNFVMNDKCAAGTGRFLQVMAVNLGMEVNQLEDLSLVEPVSLNSMCTVFAESEVVSLIAAEVPKERIVAGIYHSIAKRIAAMTGSLGSFGRATFTGGIAQNRGMGLILAKNLGCPVDIPEDPQMVGALGAAILAAQA